MVLKDQLFNIDTINYLANDIKKVYPEFDHNSFIQNSIHGFDTLELKQRMTHVEHMLETYLPHDYETSIQILTQAMEHVTKPMFVYGSVLEYIEKNGCNDQYVDLSLQKLGEFTNIMSAEFAIRPFLNKYPSKTMDKVMEWAVSEDMHQRRLASEGTRPFLPWAMQVDIHYEDASIALDYLYYDKERYVTRSVANHLNDISKINPDFVLTKLEEWLQTKKQTTKEMMYIVNHSLRTLIKKGHKDTLQFMGFKTKPLIEVVSFQMTSKTIKIGENQEFTLVLNAHESTNILIDFIVTYPTKHNRTTQKVYKLLSFKAEKGKQYPIKGKRSFKNISTRKMIPGQHRIDIQLNGTVIVSEEFEVIE